VDLRRLVEDLQRYNLEVHGEDEDLGRVGADLGPLEYGCIYGVGGVWTRRRGFRRQLRVDLDGRHRRGTTWDGGGGGCRQARSVPALLPATENPCGGCCRRAPPSVRRHAGDNCNGGECEAARRKESSEAAVREGRDGRRRRERRDWDAAAAREGEAARRKESSEAAAREGRDGRRRRERRDCGGGERGGIGMGEATSAPLGGGLGGLSGGQPTTPPAERLE
jgi:hypothetical protein